MGTSQLVNMGTALYHSPLQRLGTSDRVSGQGAWREVPCEIERVARASAI